MHLGDDRARVLHRLDQILARKSEAVASQVVRRRDLKHHDIYPQPARTDQPRQLGVMDRKNVEHARAGQLSVRSAPAVREKVERVGMLGGKYVGEADTEEDTDPLQMLTLGNERAHQRDRLSV
ncbi:hypothetical protein BCCH1_75160 [Burkholderia contaminans]|uniref:Uncharacterized protein n=1 Tax=Burkholderia contaminans TaxID=488447 RepID=A0A250LMC5_9BURK|nr:hypothetical protein BCCH1_75160 [Burkholderia contaminans]GLZ72218.1 hypothetical protein Bcon01_52630 [Burkholderia contaminans]